LSFYCYMLALTRVLKGLTALVGRAVTAWPLMPGTNDDDDDDDEREWTLLLLLSSSLLLLCDDDNWMDGRGSGSGSRARRCSGLLTPFVRQYRPHALHNCRPVPPRRQSGVCTEPQFEHSRAPPAAPPHAYNSFITPLQTSSPASINIRHMWLCGVTVECST